MKQLLRKMSSAELQELVDLIAGCTCSNVTSKSENEEATGEKLVQSTIKDYFDIVIFNFETLNKSVKEYKESIENYILEREQEFSETFAELSALRENESKGYDVEKATIDKLNKQVNDLAKIIKDKSAGASKPTPAPPGAPKPPTPAKPSTTPKPAAKAAKPTAIQKPTLGPKDFAKITAGATIAGGAIYGASKLQTQAEIINVGKKLGFDDYAIKAVMGVAEKESGTSTKRSENLKYKSASPKKLRSIFRALRTLSDAEINELRKDEVAFANVVYGSKNGNNQPGDGWKYRGRGLIQITGRGIYKQVGNMIGVDLESNPDLITKPDVAAKAAFAFLSLGKAKKQFNSQSEANREMTQVVAGRGFNLDKDALHNLEKVEKNVKAIEAQGTFEKAQALPQIPTTKVPETKPIKTEAVGKNATTKLGKQEKTRTVILPVILGYK